MSLSIFRIFVGLGLALVIALAAWQARFLSPKGAIAAAALGAVVFGLGGLGWAMLLVTFFLSSSILSRLFRTQKRALDEKFSKGAQRDAGQVAANGGIAGLVIVLSIILPEARDWAWAGFAGALAAANADTWATELGVLSRSAPRLITNGRLVERGESGGITLLGSLAALVGSALIALFAVLFWQGQIFLPPASSPAWLAALTNPQAQPLSPAMKLAWFGTITLAGFAGSLVDSYLGATLQAIYYCPNCRKETERHPSHTCGSPTHQIRGISWLNNDWVNSACTLAGALAALAGYWL